MPAKLYDWPTWLGALPITLMRGEHYRCSQAAICQQIRDAASDSGIRVSIEDRGDRVTVRRGDAAGQEG